MCSIDRGLVFVHVIFSQYIHIYVNNVHFNTCLMDIFSLGCEHRFVITSAFHYFFPATYVPTINLIVLLVKHWPNAGARRALSQTLTHHKVTSIFFFNMNVSIEFLILFNQLHIFNVVAPLQYRTSIHVARNKALCQWLSIRLLWSQQPNGKKP
jgi:hypothetical protein